MFRLYKKIEKIWLFENIRSNMCSIPNWENLSFCGSRHPSKHGILDEFDGSAVYLVLWGLFCQRYPIPEGSIRKGDTVVEPSTFEKQDKEFRVYVGQKWWPLDDVAFIQDGMVVTFKTLCGVSEKTFIFSEMQWNLKFN